MSKCGSATLLIPQRGAAGSADLAALSSPVARTVHALAQHALAPQAPAMSNLTRAATGGNFVREPTFAAVPLRPPPTSQPQPQPQPRAQLRATPGSAAAELQARRFAELVSASQPGLGARVAGASSPRASGAALPAALHAAVAAHLPAEDRQALNGVRIRDDASAPSIGARAYTLGRDVVLGPGRYRLHTQDGVRLVAHELAHVVQQHHGGRALQCDEMSADELLKQAQGTVDDVEQIRKQLAEGAESLEVVRARLMLAGGVPGAGSRVGSGTGDTVEALIESSSTLAPFIEGKRRGTQVGAKGQFNVYDFDEQFRAAHDRLERRVTPNTGASQRDVPRPMGFFHRRSDSIHLPPTATLGQALHEGIHKYSSVGMQSALGVYLNEGVTQVFTDEVLSEHKVSGSTRHAYAGQLRCARKVVGWFGLERVGHAFFTATGLGALATDLDSRLGLKDAVERVRLANDRGGEGLCERIEAAR